MFSLYAHLGEKANHCLFQIQESAKTFLGKLQKESSILKEKEKSSCLLKKKKAFILEITEHIAKYEDQNNQVDRKLK